MDRLVCGDVGYGKTEIAVRAAFKAVQDGKQVAVLVPTTLLVQQHLSDLRRADVGVPGRSSGRSAASRPTRRPRRSIAGLADGTVDIVIGTHRLLNPDIQFKDLGLVVVDEEQRFGVEHKEQLKRLRTAVDVLAHVGDADPAHAGDGDHRHPRDVDDHHPAGGAAPGAHLRRRLRGPPDRRRRSAASCCARARSSTSTTGCSRSSKAAARHPRAGPRGAGRHRARPDGRAPARAGDGRLLGEAVRRARLHDDRRVRARRLQRQHADHRARRHARPQPAAPAARPGRPRPRAGLRLLPLPAGEAAHRDRARAARHHRPALRPRRRHGDRDEGPRDPRRRQPARRRAVRPHRRRRLRPLRAAGRRGGQRVQGRRRAEEPAR